MDKKEKPPMPTYPVPEGWKRMSIKMVYGTDGSMTVTIVDRPADSAEIDCG